MSLLFLTSLPRRLDFEIAHSGRERGLTRVASRDGGSSWRRRAVKMGFFFFFFFLWTYRDLLPQEIQVLLAVSQALLGRAELVDEQFFGFGDRVGEHDVGLVFEEGRVVSVLRG